MSLTGFINGIVFKTEQELVKAQEQNIIKAYDLPAWVMKLEKSKIGRFAFRVYARCNRIRIKHEPDSIDFYKRGIKVAEVEMIERFKKGKFKKL